MDISNVDQEDLKNAGEIINNAAKSFLGKRLLNTLGNYFNRRNSAKDRQKSIGDENEKIVSSAQAEVKADLIRFNAELEKGGLLADYIKKAGNTLISERIRKDFNINSTVGIAVDQLEQENSTANNENIENVSEDWFSRWTSVVEDISDEEVQRVWASILAGEIRKPGSFSLRSLDTIRNLSKEEAEAFIKFANFVMTTTSGFKFVFKKNMETLDTVNNAITLDEMRLIEEAGLVSPGSSTLFGGLQLTVFGSNDAGTAKSYRYGNLHLQINVGSNVTGDCQEGIITLTKAGTELYDIITPTPNLEYLKEIKNMFLPKSSNLTLSIHDIVSKGKQQYSYKMVGTYI